MSETPTPTPTPVPAPYVPDPANPPVFQVVQAPIAPTPIVEGMDETHEGGYYMVDGSPVDAEGRPVKKRK